MPKEDIYWNETDSPIFIVTKWHADPEGGRAIHDTEICVAPDTGIDVSILGLKRRDADVQQAKGK